MNDDGSEKSHFWFALYFFVRVIRVSFLCLKLCEKKNDIFLYEAKQIPRKFLLQCPRSLDNSEKGLSTL